MRYTKGNPSTLLAIFKYLLPYKFRMIAAATALILTAVATLSLGKGIEAIIDQGFGSNDQAALTEAITTLLMISGVIAIGTFIRFYYVSWLGERVSADLRKAVFANLVYLHPGYFETNRPGEIMSRLTTDTTLLQTIIGSWLSLALRSTLTLSGALVMMFITNLKLSLIITAGVPLILLPILVFGRRVRKLSSSSQESVASVGSYAGEIFQQIKVVQSHLQEKFEINAFDGEVEKAFEIARRRVRQRALLVCAAMIMVFGGFAGMMSAGGNDVITGQMTAGELGSFAFYAIMVGSGFATLSEVWGEIQRAAGAAERLLELLDASSNINDSKRDFKNSSEGSLSIRNISFFYPSRPTKLALNELSLDIDTGTSLALVGPSGGGKSTVFELLHRFYDPSEGAILFNDTDIRMMSLQSLRREVGLVPQQPVLFTSDVRYNIAYGKPSATEDEVVAAAKASHAHEFISQLPDGYSSHLGEQGIRLSGGQKQRIALARAILNDPKILLLDEATSALDSDSEREVQLALKDIMQNRTTLIIAHRLSTILHVDKIAVIDEGRVVATGSHSELVKTNRLYARLAKIQFRDSQYLVPKGD